jgi:acyl-CoA synthetase (AMP-forming)/AMP-acid ligase II
MRRGQDELLRCWGATLAERADDAAIFDTRGAVLRSFADIAREAAGYAEELLGDFAPGEVVAIAVGNHPAWAALLLACLQRELVVLPLEQEREAACSLCHARAMIDGELRLTSVEAAPVDWGEHAPVLLKLTSGTTATPRAIRFRSAQLLADCVQICETMGISERDLNFAVIPLSHSYGFSNLITPLIVRGVPMVLSSDRMPRAVLDDIARTDATVFPGMPVFFHAFCEMPSASPMPKLRLCISAGAPLPLPVGQKFRDRFGLTIHSFYGSSECGGICYDREARLIEPGFIGEAMNGVDLTLCDDGRIEVRSAAVGDGYFPEPDEARLTSGRFVPDDLLARSGNGFRIVGRNSEVINVAGKKVHPAEIEAVLLAHNAVREAAVFARESSLRNEEIAACIVATSGIGEADLLDFCRARLSSWQVPRRIFFLSEMPVNERGKISRRALAEHVAQARW